MCYCVILHTMYSLSYGLFKTKEILTSATSDKVRRWHFLLGKKICPNGHQKSVGVNI